MTPGGQRTWRLPRPLLEDHIVLAFIVWGVVLAVLCGILVGVAWFGSVTQSAVEIASGIFPWYVAIMSGYIMHTMFPVFIAHGRTRRDSAIEMAIVITTIMVLTSVLMVVAFQAEWVLYRIADWPTALSDENLFDSRGDIARMLAQFLAQALVWGSSGALVGAAIYRFRNEGYISLVPAGLAISFPSTFIERDGPLSSLVDFGDVSALVAIACSIVAAMIVGGLTWLVVRRTPMRSLQA